jgi:hypothetical protein
MNPYNADNPSRATQLHSPFWALCLVFLSLIFLQVSYVTDDFKERDQIQAARTQLNLPLAQAQTLNQITEAVGRDLLTLSTNSVEAAKIVAEFNIRINNPPNPSK